MANWHQLNSASARRGLMTDPAAGLSETEATRRLAEYGRKLGFSQEYRAEKAIAALKKLAVPSVRVRRDGEVREIPASLLVSGDIIVLECRNFVVADCRLLASASLQTREAALIGESELIQKTTDTIAQADLPLGDRRNMAYMGTFVTGGRAEAVVTETGMRTELGRIAKLIQ